MKEPHLPAMIARLDYLRASQGARLQSLRATGIHTVLAAWPNHTPYCFGWDGRGHYDYRPLEAELDALAEIDPDVRFLLGFGSYHGAPYYWAVDHTDELAHFHVGVPMQAPSLASARWRQDSCEAARRFAAHLSTGRHGARVVGFVPYSTGWDWHGVGETHVELFGKASSANIAYPTEGDVSQPMVMAFRAFLRDKYGCDAALQAAWRDAGATLECAALPQRVDVRSPLPHVADYFECYNRLNAQLAVAWCEALKTGAPGCLTGVSHGFVFGYPNGEALHPQGCGHNAPEILLASPAIDFFLSSPAGSDGAGDVLSQHALGSLRLAGKTHVHVFEGANLALRTEAEQRRALYRAAGCARVHGSRLALGEACRGPLSPGMAHEQAVHLPYDSDGMRQEVSRVRHAMELHAAPPAGVAADAAVFFSPRACYRRALESTFGAERVEAFRNQVLLRSGLCFDEYLLDDFTRVAEQYHLWIFLDCPDIDGPAWLAVTQRPERAVFATGNTVIARPEELRAAAARAGAHVWCTTDDAVFAGHGCLLFVAHVPGEKHLRLPAPMAVHNAWSGEVVSAKTETVRFTAEAGEALLLALA